MRKLNEIASDLQTLLASGFQTVRISVSQSPAQLLSEIRAINPDSLPGVIIAFDSLNYQGMSMTVVCRVKLILIDQFRSGSDQRALSALQAASGLMAFFPADGKEINGVYYYPQDCVSASPDPQFAAIAIGLEIKQGSL